MDVIFVVIKVACNNLQIVFDKEGSCTTNRGGREWKEQVTTPQRPWLG